jgi:hypothetical protein
MAFKVCCSCGEQNITIRRYDTDTGETLWEYGPGENWTPHYGSDLITGWYVPANTVLNKRVQSSIGGGTWLRPGLTEYIRPRAALNAVWANRTVTNINENILQPAAGDGNTCSPVLPVAGAPDTQAQQWTLRNFLQSGSITSVTLWMRVRFDSNSDGTIDGARVRLNGTWYTGSVINLPSSGAWGWASMTITTAFGSININTLPAFEVTAGLLTADATVELDTAYVEARIVGASAGLSPNAAEALHFVTLNAEDGSVENDIVVPGAFVSGTTKGNYRPTDFPTTLFGLSGGNVVTGGGPPPVLELVDFADNNATKYYTLHGHSYKLGNVTLVTVGNVSCVFATTASNATIEAAIDALTEVSSVTVTGGPWPHKAVDITIVWTAFSGDWKLFSVDNTSGGKLTRAGATLFDYDTGEIIGAVGAECGLGTGVTATKLLASGKAAVPTPSSAPSVIAGPVVTCASNNVLLMQISSNSTLESWTPGATWTRNWVIWINAPQGVAGVSNCENDTIVTTHLTTSDPDFVSLYNDLGKWGEKISCSSGGITDMPVADNSVVSTWLGEQSSSAVILTDGDSNDGMTRYGSVSLREISLLYYGSSLASGTSNCFPFTAGANLARLDVTLDESPQTDANHADYYSRFPASGPGGITASLLLGSDAANVSSVFTDATVKRVYAKLDDVTSAPILGSYKRFWWHYQIDGNIRATGGEFRMKFKWDTGGFTFLYTDWLSYTDTTETELHDALNELLGPPGAAWDDSNFPIVQVGYLIPQPSFDTDIGAAASAPVARTAYSLLERGITVIYTTDRTTAATEYIPSGKQFVFDTTGNITFEFRNMTTQYDGDTIAMWSRENDPQKQWGRKWIPRPKAPNRPSGSWIKDGRTIGYSTESKAELPPPP